MLISLDHHSCSNTFVSDYQQLWIALSSFDRELYENQAKCPWIFWFYFVFADHPYFLKHLPISHFYLYDGKNSWYMVDSLACIEFLYVVFSATYN